MPSSALISTLARSFLAGEVEVEAVEARGARTLGRSWRWLRPLAERYVERFSQGARPRLRDAVRFLLEDADFRRAQKKYREQIQIAEWIAEPQRMQPVEAAREWGLPAIETLGDLADWLCLSPDELDWFADLKALGNKLRNPKLQHYHYRALPKRSGGIRLTEAPKPWLKELQRRVLSGILDRVPIHPAVHGFVKGRSIATFAAPHVGRRVLLRLDFEDFFPAFPAARVHGLFRTFGYPEAVSDRLAGLTTNAVPRDFWTRCPAELDPVRWSEARILYSRRHLPQGAPASPALANLMTYRLDCRLAGLARPAGARYTRYADDVAFSGDEEFERSVEGFVPHVAAIAMEEGFAVNHHKTRVMRRGVRQQLAGVVVNEKLNVPRRDSELLEAILTNCARRGPQTQNRAGVPDFRAHLEGRAGFVEMVNGETGRRLKELLKTISWS